MPLIMLDVATWNKPAQTCIDFIQPRVLQESCVSGWCLLLPGLISQAVEIPSFILVALGRSAVQCRGSWGTCSCWKYHKGSWPCAPSLHVRAWRGVQQGRILCLMGEQETEERGRMGENWQHDLCLYREAALIWPGRVSHEPWEATRWRMDGKRCCP